MPSAFETYLIEYYKALEVSQFLAAHISKGPTNKNDPRIIGLGRLHPEDKNNAELVASNSTRVFNAFPLKFQSVDKKTYLPFQEKDLPELQKLFMNLINNWSFTINLDNEDDKQAGKVIIPKRTQAHLKNFIMCAVELACKELLDGSGNIKPSIAGILRLNTVNDEVTAHNFSAINDLKERIIFSYVSEILLYVCGNVITNKVAQEAVDEKGVPNKAAVDDRDVYLVMKVINDAMMPIGETKFSSLYNSTVGLTQNMISMLHNLKLLPGNAITQMIVADTKQLGDLNVFSHKQLSPEKHLSQLAKNKIRFWLDIAAQMLADKDSGRAKIILEAIDAQYHLKQLCYMFAAGISSARHKFDTDILEQYETIKKAIPKQPTPTLAAEVAPVVNYDLMRMRDNLSIISMINTSCKTVKLNEKDVAALDQIELLKENNAVLKLQPAEFVSYVMKEIITKIAPKGNLDKVVSGYLANTKPDHPLETLLRDRNAVRVEAPAVPPAVAPTVINSPQLLGSSAAAAVTPAAEKNK